MGRQIKLKIWIHQSPSALYSAITDPRQLEKWLVPKVESTPDRPDEMTFKWPHHAFEVRLLESTPDKSVAMSWYDKNGVGPTVRFDIEPVNDGSMVTLTHDGFSSEEKHLEMYCNHIEGWSMYLCNLRCALDFDCDLRADQPPGTIAM